MNSIIIAKTIKERKKDQEQVREKAFREMKKRCRDDHCSKKVRKQEGWKWDQSLFCISSQQSLHIRQVTSDYSVVMCVYVGIVGWIYRTKIDPISILLVSLLFLSSGHPYIFFSFHEMLFPLSESAVALSK